MNMFVDHIFQQLSWETLTQGITRLAMCQSLAFYRARLKSWKPELQACIADASKYTHQVVPAILFYILLNSIMICHHCCLVSLLMLAVIFTAAFHNNILACRPHIQFIFHQSFQTELIVGFFFFFFCSRFLLEQVCRMFVAMIYSTFFVTFAHTICHKLWALYSVTGEVFEYFP